jgi:lysophospholipase L1-like esterase
MRFNLLLYIAFLFQAAQSQIPAVPLDMPEYTFIQYNANRFELVRENPWFGCLFSKFDSLIKTGNNQIRIVHLGGSHIQADVYTHRIRQELQTFYPGVLGSRGFLFPYTIAHTNSPSNLSISYSGDWQTCKNTQSEPAFTLGLSGITAALISSTGSLKIVASFDTLRHYDFNRIRIFCNVAENGIIPEFNACKKANRPIVHREAGFIQYDFSGYADTLSILIQQGDSTKKPFELYGISIENDDPGVVYNAIGVNGAKLESYLRCSLFVEQLKALEPDWVIVSIGTNDGNTREFDPEAYRNEYLKLLDSIRLAAPAAAILLTVPNDSYLFKRYINPNTARMREVIFDIALSNSCGVWDFYDIMGGLNSAKAWYDQGLMTRDHIHFSKPGYLLKGDLFYGAFLKSWDDHLLQTASDNLSPNTNLQTLIPHIQIQTSGNQHPHHD